jgi:hypothetical protein
LPLQLKDINVIIIKNAQIFFIVVAWMLAESSDLLVGDESRLSNNVFSLHGSSELYSQSFTYRVLMNLQMMNFTFFGNTFST